MSHITAGKQVERQVDYCGLRNRESQGGQQKIKLLSDENSILPKLSQELVAHCFVERPAASVGKLFRE